VTYWNSGVAGKAGMSLRGAGQCGPGTAKLCSATTLCPAGTFCDRHLSNKNQCGSDLTGVCVGLPAVCPIDLGTQIRPCGAVTCTGQCNAIRTQAQWWEDGSCP
jgi:hypothetical protein